MYILASSILLLVLVLIAGIYTYTYTGHGYITADTAKLMIATGRIKTVVDVRTGWEWNRGHYPTAIHLPVSQMTRTTIRDLKANRVLQDPVVVYCNTGQRARMAAETLRTHGVDHVYYIAEHWEALM